MSSCDIDQGNKTTIQLAGNIQNADKDTVYLERNGDIHKLPVAEDGSFAGSFEGEKGYYELSYKREATTTFLLPGDTLKIEFDLRKFDETIEYSGENSSLNNYLAEKYLFKEEIGKAMSMRDLYKMPEDSFLNQLNLDRDKVLAMIDKQELPSWFKEIETSNIKYEFLKSAGNYESYHKYFAKLDSFTVSDKFNEQFANIDYTIEDEFINIPEYRNMVLNYYTNAELPECLDKLASCESMAIKNASLERLVNWLSPGLEDLKKHVDTMVSMTDDEELKMELNESYENMKLLTRGNSSPGFNFKDVNNNMVSLEDLKGKNVYIDVWATWCGPCKVEIPHLKELEESYHDKNIAFVSISVDVPEDEIKWKNMIKDKELKGIQLISDNGWDTDFVNNYLIRGIPRFILLDSDGKIVSSDAPRPSSNTKIKNMIDELLIQA